MFDKWNNKIHWIFHITYFLLVFRALNIKTPLTKTPFLLLSIMDIINSQQRIWLQLSHSQAGDLVWAIVLCIEVDFIFDFIFTDVLWNFSVSLWDSVVAHHIQIVDLWCPHDIVCIYHLSQYFPHVICLLTTTDHQMNIFLAWYVAVPRFHLIVENN